MRCEVDDIAALIRSSAESLPNVKIQHNDFEEVKHYEVTIINEMWDCPGLRKVHLEVAKTKHLDVLHCVFFPDPRFNLPIFGTDLVVGSPGISAAIVDLSPVTSILPKYFHRCCSIPRHLQTPQAILTFLG